MADVTRRLGQWIGPIKLGLTVREWVVLHDRVATGSTDRQMLQVFMLVTFV